jgi:hypothetical protein
MRSSGRDHPNLGETSQHTPILTGICTRICLTVPRRRARLVASFTWSPILNGIGSLLFMGHRRGESRRRIKEAEEGNNFPQTAPHKRILPYTSHGSRRTTRESLSGLGRPYPQRKKRAGAGEQTRGPEGRDGGDGGGIHTHSAMIP